ncbi:MAG: polysaccharide deacetylase family protein [Deltaproteobacteria bacterium]
MTRLLRVLAGITLLATLCLCCQAALADDQVSVPILLYHRFGPTVADSMTTKTKVFAAQLKWLKDHQYTVIPLRTLVNYLRGQGPPPPAKSVVIVADDGHKTVYSDMLPLVRQYKIPVTLFIYPSCISNASYAMTWKQLKNLQQTGLFDLQGHTFWHPNFKKDKKKMTPAQFQKDLHRQLVVSKAVLEKHFGAKVDMLAWPFGIYNKELEDAAAKAGYVVAFSIDRRNASKSENLMAEPRYLLVNADQGKRFAAIVEGRAQEKRHRTY